MCATVTSASWLASLASPTAAQRAFGRLCWLPAVLGTPSNVEVSERPAAAEAAPGGFRCSARAGRTPAMISRACCAFVPLMTPTCVPWRAQAVYRRARAADIARWRCAPRATARRGKWQVSSLGVLGRVRERAHPAGRRENEQRRAGVHARQFPGLPQVGARSGTTFQCTPDPETHFPSPPPTRPTIGMLNLVLKIPSSVSGSSRRSHRAKPRARSIWADFAVHGP